MPKVLIVDDSALFSQMTKKVLVNSGYEVDVAADGVEALGKARAWLPDIILMDVMMPKMSGVKVLEQLKADAQTDKIKVVMLTNLAREEDAKRAKALGALKYLIKSDNDPKQVLKLVAGMVGAGKKAPAKK